MLFFYQIRPPQHSIIAMGPLVPKFMGPTRGPTWVLVNPDGPMLAPWTLLLESTLDQVIACSPTAQNHNCSHFNYQHYGRHIAMQCGNFMILSFVVAWCGTSQFYSCYQGLLQWHLNTQVIAPVPINKSTSICIAIISNPESTGHTVTIK